MGTIKTTNIETITGSGTLTIGQSGETISVPSGATLTVPSGGLSGQNYPAFQAKLSSNQVISDATLTKVAVNSELFDSDGCYNNTGSTTTLNGISVPSYSFAPNVSGKYFIFGSITYNPSDQNNIARVIMQFVVNGTYISNSDNTFNSSTFPSGFSIYHGLIVDLNGTSDYVHMEAYLDASGTPEVRILGDSTESRTWFGAYRLGD